MFIVRESGLLECGEGDEESISFVNVHLVPYSEYCFDAKWSGFQVMKLDVITFELYLRWRFHECTIECGLRMFRCVALCEYLDMVGALMWI